MGEVGSPTAGTQGLEMQDTGLSGLLDKALDSLGDGVVSILFSG